MNKLSKASVIGLTFLVLCICSINANALSFGAIDGLVIDIETGTPVPGAIVAIKWAGESWQVVQSTSSCFHEEVVRADESGKFHTDAWSLQRRMASGVDASFYAYMPGYIHTGLLHNENNNQSTLPGHQARNEDLVKTVGLKPFQGTKKERLAYLRRLMGRTGCTGGVTNLLLLYEPMFQEAESLPETGEDKETVREMQRILDYSLRPPRE